MSKRVTKKRQYTMHLIFNAGKGDQARGMCELVFRGKGLRINQGEKAVWNPNVKVFWQDKAWVESKVMRELLIVLLRTRPQLMETSG
jgi:hypothetical protein